MDNCRILGSSPQSQLLQKLVEQAAPTRVPVMIFGERGTGREFIAVLLHQGSGRSGAFERLSCAGLSPSVLDAELSERIARADRGTLFLDNIEDLPPHTQTELTCFLVSGAYRDTRPDVRVVAATTDLSLEKRAATGDYNLEFYNTVRGIRIQLVALRERRPDIPILVEHFIKESARKHAKPVKGIQPSALKKLMAYSWPGNIREAQDAVERAVGMAQGELLTLEHFGFLLTAEEERPLQFLIPGATIQEIEKEAILRTLEHAAGSTTAAARILNMSVRKIQYKLKQYRNGTPAPLKAQSAQL